MMFDAVRSIVSWEMGWGGSGRGARALLRELRWSEHIAGGQELLRHSFTLRGAPIGTAPITHLVMEGCYAHMGKSPLPFGLLGYLIEEGNCYGSAMAVQLKALQREMGSVAVCEGNL